MRVLVVLIIVLVLIYALVSQRREKNDHLGFSYSLNRSLILGRADEADVWSGGCKAQG